MKIHCIPQLPFIDDGATLLYKLEERRNNAIT